MPTLLIRFPARRYHATPWGHHVNEGLIEWPPSPWRLLRALLATGYGVLHWDGNPAEPWTSSPPALARALVCKLAGVLPRYRLPAACGAHSRHFMPTAQWGNGGREKTTLVFDTFAQVEEGVLAVTWDVALDDAETTLLAQLAAGLSYLGRSESWVQASLADPAQPLPPGEDCQPCAHASHPGPGWEQVPLLALVAEADFNTWRNRAIEQALLPYPLPDRKPSKKLLDQRAKARAPFPDDLIACLQVDTAWLRGHGWSQPPGSQRVLYWRRADALAPGMYSPPRPAHLPAVPFVLLALAAPTHNNHVLPPRSRTLPQAELLHRYLVRIHAAQGHAVLSPVVTGCDPRGRPLAGAHRHGHVLPLDLDSDGHLDHVLFWAPDGWDAAAQEALSAMRHTYTKGVSGALRLAVAAAGCAGDLSRLPAPFGDALQGTVGAGTRWTSDTPFVPPRYLKKRGGNALEGQVIAELAHRGFPEPQAIEWLFPQADELARLHRHTVRVRRHGPPPPIDMACTLRLHFAQPVSGPICLGYGSHFGLGRFQCDEPAPA